MNYFKVTIENEGYYDYDSGEPIIDRMEYIVTRHLRNGDGSEKTTYKISEDSPVDHWRLFHRLVLHYIGEDSRYSVMGDGDPWSGFTVAMSDEDYGRMVILNLHSQNVTIHYGIYVVDVMFEKIEKPEYPLLKET